MIRRLSLLLVSGLYLLTAEAGTVFWLEPRSNIILDQQTSATIANKGSLVVLRAPRNGPAPQYDFPALVQRLKSGSQSLPVLSYGWATRQASAGRIEAYLLRNLDSGRALAEIDAPGNGSVRFLDVTNPELRQRIVGELVKGKRELGVDGLVLDLSTRTPAARPQQLARICRANVGFCPRYAAGMDALFDDLARAMGPNALLGFNGFFNFTDGQLDDQVQLLAHANLAAVEYFGLNPNQREHSFRNDVLPYLRTIAALPREKAALVFARGPWFYTDYVADYRWQRYLYASFLLAAREQDLFKYHATFQVPTNKGRSGGLDFYADWSLPLGPAQGDFSHNGGIYQRRFNNGLVAVAPDDGRGGVLRLERTYYTPEGQRIQGEVSLEPGTGVILLSRNNDTKPVRHVIGARAIAAWRWANSQLEEGANPVIRLSPLPEKLPGEHDLLLDYERSLTPFRQLGISVQAESPDAEILAIAEVDDPRREKMWLVVRLGSAGAVPAVLESIDFRSPAKKNDPALWPVIQAGELPGQPGGGTITLDGPPIAAASGLIFRRWSHVRLSGPLSLREVTLSSPTALDDGRR